MMSPLEELENFGALEGKICHQRESRGPDLETLPELQTLPPTRLAQDS
jgi:hypothetical protein